MRILIVEDEVQLARSLKKGLEKQGYAADWLDNGEKAMTRITMHRDQYDAVVLDLMLPGRSGLDICRATRERGVKVPILILTAKDQTANKIVLLDAGADDYLVKPFIFAELLARLRALMRRPDHALPPALSVRDITLDTAHHTVHRGDQLVSLTTKEFALLEFFLRNPNQVHSREDILDHVWDFNFDSFSNVVDVHVKNLRKKLGNDVIETVRGVGYRSPS